MYKILTEEEIDRILNEPRARTCACCGAESSEGLCLRCENALEEQERITEEAQLEEARAVTDEKVKEYLSKAPPRPELPGKEQGNWDTAFIGGPEDE